jgi:CRP/FNR family transcriptional regulator
MKPNLDLLKVNDSRFVEEFKSVSFRQHFPAGKQVAMEGDQCMHFFVVLSGVLRVYKISERGREITLYRVHPGQSCILTSFGVLTQTDFPAFAVAETEVELLLTPADITREWVNKYESWRRHFFENMSIRIIEILQALENIAFKRLDGRLAAYLLERFPDNLLIIKITHEELAREIGANRVSISRILEDWKNEGIIELARGKIIVKNRNKILEIARS